MKKKYTVTIHFEGTINYCVFAEDEDEAEELALEWLDDLPDADFNAYTGSNVEELEVTNIEKNGWWNY